MLPATCISSQLMGEVLGWRNPQGKEENWTCSPLISHPGKAWGKKTVAELGIVLAAVSALVETVAYAVFTTISLGIYPLKKRPYFYFKTLLQSSSFTVLWGIFNAIFYNLRKTQLLTREPLVRLWCEKRWGFSFLYRREDLQENIQWVNYGEKELLSSEKKPPFLEEIFKELENKTLLQTGVQFFKNYVLNQLGGNFFLHPPLVSKKVLIKSILIFLEHSLLLSHPQVALFLGFLDQKEFKNLSKIQEELKNQTEGLKVLTTFFSDPKSWIEKEIPRASQGVLKILHPWIESLEKNCFVSFSWCKACEPLYSEA